MKLTNLHDINFDQLFTEAVDYEGRRLQFIEELEKARVECKWAARKVTQIYNRLRSASTGFPEDVKPVQLDLPQVNSHYFKKRFPILDAWNTNVPLNKIPNTPAYLDYKKSPTNRPGDPGTKNWISETEAEAIKDAALHWVPIFERCLKNVKLLTSQVGKMVIDHRKNAAKQGLPEPIVKDTRYKDDINLSKAEIRKQNELRQRQGLTRLRKRALVKPDWNQNTAEKP